MTEQGVPVVTSPRLGHQALTRRITAVYGVTAVFFVHGMLFASWVAHIPQVKAQLGIGLGLLGVALVGHDRPLMTEDSKDPAPADVLPGGDELPTRPTLSEAQRAAAFSSSRAPVDRAAALRAGSVPVPRKFVLWAILGFAVLGLGGVAVEHFVGNAGAVDNARHACRRRRQAESATDAAVEAYITKPVDKDSLLGVLARLQPDDKGPGQGSDG